MTTRRGSGEGAIYQRGDGNWCASIDLGLTDDGRRRRKVLYGKTRTEAREKLLKAQRENNERRLATTSPTFEAWLDEWLNDIADIRPSTKQSYESNIRNHIKPALGHRRLDRLETAHVRALYAKMRRQGLSDSTISQCHAIIRRALLIAMRENRVSMNVADNTHMEPPAQGDNPRTPLTLEQCRAVLEAAKDDPYESRWYAALYGGLRQGEALGLAWRHVDLTDGTVAVERSLQREQGTFVFVPPKSKHSIRTVPMLTALRSRLTIHLAAERAAGRGGADDLVWNRNGKPISAQHDAAAWRALLVKADVPHVALHAARNSTGSLLMVAGVPDKLSAEILGHGSVKVTQQHYQKGDLTLRRAAMAQLEAYVSV